MAFDASLPGGLAASVALGSARSGFKATPIPNASADLTLGVGDPIHLMGRTVGLVGLITSFLSPIKVHKYSRAPSTSLSVPHLIPALVDVASGAVAKALDGRGGGKGGRFQRKCQKVAGSSDDATNAFPKDSNRTAAC